METMNAPETNPTPEAGAGLEMMPQGEAPTAEKPEGGEPPAYAGTGEGAVAAGAPEIAPTPASGPAGEEIQRAQYSPIPEQAPGKPLGNIDYLKDVNLEAGVELGTATLSVEQILGLGVGSIVELNQTVGEPVRLLINNNLYALGEVVVIGEKFGVRIGKLLHV